MSCSNHCCTCIHEGSIRIESGQVPYPDVTNQVSFLVLWDNLAPVCPKAPVDDSALGRRVSMHRHSFDDLKAATVHNLLGEFLQLGSKRWQLEVILCDVLHHAQAWQAARYTQAS